MLFKSLSKIFLYVFYLNNRCYFHIDQTLVHKMERRPSKLLHRIKAPNAIAPLHTISYHYSASANKRRRIMLYMNRLLKKQKIHSIELLEIAGGKPTEIDDIKKFCEKCPTTAMSRFLEKKILKKVDAKGLEYRHPSFLKEVMAEVREEFLKITRDAGVRMIVKSDKTKFRVGPYKRLGRTENYHLYLQIRKQLKKRFILHQSLVRKILNECIVKLPYVLLNFHNSLKNQYDLSSFQTHIGDCAKETVQSLQHFYRNIVTLVERDTTNSKTYLSACTGLLSVNISRSIAHTFMHLAEFTGSKDHVPYLQLNITFKERLVLSPTPDDIVETYSDFLKNVIDSVQQFYVLEKYKFRGYENKQIFLCITEDFLENVKSQIRTNIEDKFIPILQFINNLDKEFADIYSDISSVGAEVVSDINFEAGCEKIQYFKSYLPKVAFIPDNAYFVLGQLNIVEYREVLQQTLLDMINDIFQNLSNQHRWENSDICEAFSIINMRAQQKSCTTEELIEIGKYMSWVGSI